MARGTKPDGTIPTDGGVFDDATFNDQDLVFGEYENISNMLGNWLGKDEKEQAIEQQQSEHKDAINDLEAEKNLGSDSLEEETEEAESMYDYFDEQGELAEIEEQEPIISSEITETEEASQYTYFDGEPTDWQPVESETPTNDNELELE